MEGHLMQLFATKTRGIVRSRRYITFAPESDGWAYSHGVRKLGTLIRLIERIVNDLFGTFSNQPSSVETILDMETVENRRLQKFGSKEEQILFHLNFNTKMARTVKGTVHY